MAKIKGTGKVDHFDLRAGSVLLVVTALCVAAPSFLHRPFRVWRVQQAGASAAAATAVELSTQEEESVDQSSDEFTFWRGNSMLFQTAQEQQGVPSPTFHAMLRRIAPTRMGTLVELAPAPYRYVPVLRDDQTDMHSAHMLDSAGMPVALLPANIDEGRYAEFRIYLSGRELLERGDAESAQQQWRALLDLPAELRPWRSTWAAFMTGRSYQKSDPAEAIRWFQRTRELVAEGFADTLGLAVASIGWEARAELDRGHTGRAIAFYLEQFAAGDPTAHPSLDFVVRRIVDLPEERLVEFARDPIASAVITAWVIAGPKHGTERGNWTDQFGERWCNALERWAQVPTPHDDLFAWLAQQSNRPALVARWVETANPDSDLLPWLRSRMALRSGNRLAAIESLRGVIARMPQMDGEQDGERDGEARWRFTEPHFMCEWPTQSRQDRARAELGTLLASEGDFEGALREFLAAGDWDDAAYFAEWVLTADELACFVDAIPEGRNERERSARGAMRYLLARSMLRSGRLGAAMEYLPTNLHPALTALRNGLSVGYDWRRAAVERATALREAARITRAQGVDLFGFGLGSEGCLTFARFNVPDFGMRRAACAGLSPFGATDLELERADASSRTALCRYAHRYAAAELAWRAASLLPDNDPMTAETLWEGGRYLMYVDDQRANRFYKALVRRCRQTPLGKEAERIHWIPKQNNSVAQSTVKPQIIKVAIASEP